MKIELIEFYPGKSPKNKNFVGNAHIYLIDADIDVRGIAVFRIKNGYFVRMPDRFSKDLKTGKEVRFPVIRFANNMKQQAMIKEVVRLVTEHLNEKKNA